MNAVDEVKLFVIWFPLAVWGCILAGIWICDKYYEWRVRHWKGWPL